MTRDELAALKAAAEKASDPDNWRVRPSRMLVDPEAILRLLARVERLEAALRKIVKASPVEPCAAAVIEGQYCDAAATARWCVREAKRALAATQEPDRG